MRDIRVRTGFCDHPKTLRLVAAAGEGAVRCLLRFWGWVADNRPQGALGDMTAMEIEHQARWVGKAGKFVDALRTVGFLDGEPGAFAVHDWEEEQPYVFHADKRVARAKKAAAARYARDGEPDHAGALGGSGVGDVTPTEGSPITREAAGEEGGSRIAPAGSNAPSTAPSSAPGSAPGMPAALRRAGGKHAGGSAGADAAGMPGAAAPLPAPTPLPAPLAKTEEIPSPDGEGESPAAPADPAASPAESGQGGEKGQGKRGKRAVPDCPYLEIMGLYNELLADKGLPRCEKMSDGRRRALRPRWVEHPDPGWWQRYFGEIAAGQRFLFGNNDRKWRADFDFLIRESGMLHVLEGKYADKGGAAGGMSALDAWGKGDRP